MQIVEKYICVQSSGNFLEGPTFNEFFLNRQSVSEKLSEKEYGKGGDWGS